MLQVRLPFTSQVAGAAVHTHIYTQVYNWSVEPPGEAPMRVARFRWQYNFYIVRFYYLHCFYHWNLIDFEDVKFSLCPFPDVWWIITFLGHFLCLHLQSGWLECNVLCNNPFTGFPQHCHYYWHLGLILHISLHNTTQWTLIKTIFFCCVRVDLK